jgi:hypothetical protein
MRKILISILIPVLYMGLSLSNQLPAEALEQQAIILFMQGDVKIKEARASEWVSAIEGLTLFSGDRLKTEDNSWAEIAFGKDYENAVRIQEWTLIELSDLGPVEINLLEGELRALVEKLSKDETFEIRTASSVCGVRGTGWDMIIDASRVIVDVYEYDVYLAGLSKKIGTIAGSIINAGKRGVLEDPTKPILIKDLPPGKMQDWKRWKENFLKRKETAQGIKGKLKKVKQSQKALQDMIKGKQGIYEKKDKDLIKNRFEESDDLN